MITHAPHLTAPATPAKVRPEQGARPSLAGPVLWALLPYLEAVLLLIACRYGS